MENKRLTDDELKAIRERVAKATPGPWRVDEHVEEIENGRGEWILRGDYVEDVQFCASARADIPALLAHIAALEAENAALRAELDNKRIAFKQLLALHNEYMAEFIEGGGIVFRGITDAARIEPGSVAYDPAHVYVMGVDWGRVNDNTVISVIDSTTRQQVYEDAFTDKLYETQRARLIAAYEQWKPSVIYAEANAMGGPNIEALQKDGLPVIPFTTGASKGPLIDALALAIERGQLDIPNDYELKRELSDYEMTPLPKGGYRDGDGLPPIVDAREHG